MLIYIHVGISYARHLRGLTGQYYLFIYGFSDVLKTLKQFFSLPLRSMGFKSTCLSRLALTALRLLPRAGRQGKANLIHRLRCLVARPGFVNVSVRPPGKTLGASTNNLGAYQRTLMHFLSSYF